MSNLLKDIAVLLFSAGEEIEQKADEYKQKREERYKEFEEQVKEKREQFKEKSEDFKSRFEHEVNYAKENWSELTDKMGFVSKKEFNELKDIIAQLNEKLDKMTQDKS